MGADSDGLCALLRLGGHSVSITGILQPPPRMSDLADSAQAEVLDLYRRLGGRHETPTLRPGSWDLQVDDILVVLDEQLHFNRYRAVTLQSGVYRSLPSFPLLAYQRFCDTWEGACLKAGSGQGRWMNISTEGHFGPSGPRGDLSGDGSSRWKQRALYDFMKDVTQLDQEPPRMARIGIWDELPGLAGVTVENVVHRTPEPRFVNPLRALISARSDRPL
jgi:hypothetical protein